MSALKRPSEEELKRLLDLPADAPLVAPKPGCPECHGTGMRIVTRGNLRGAEPCPCGKS